MVGLALAPHLHRLALARKLQVDAASHFAELQHTRGVAHLQLQSTVVQVPQQHGMGLAVEFDGKAARHHTVRAPAVTLAERAPAHARTLVQQRTRDSCGGGQWQADLFLVEQHSLLTLDQCGVQLRLGKRMAACHQPQELHIGGQPHDTHLLQRSVEPRQCLFTGVAVYDEFGHHRVVERRNGVTLAHARVHPCLATFEGHTRGQAVHM